MYKKLLITFSILIISIFSFSICFAANDDGHMLQDAANAIEDGARDIANTTKSATGAAENSMNNNSNSMQNNNRSSNSTYTATRTATSTTNPTFLGMTSTAWTWLIIGIAGIAIVALVWYYGSQIRTSNEDE